MLVHISNQLSALAPCRRQCRSFLNFVGISLSSLVLSGCVIAHDNHKRPVVTKQVVTYTSTSDTPKAVQYGFVDGKSLSDEQAAQQANLDSALAPMALYPDSLLEHIFAAVTQPMDLIQARQLLDANPDVQLTRLLDMAQDKPWDPSVIALLPFADVIINLTDDLEYLEYLGEVVEHDYALVAQRLRYLRVQAQQNGNLNSDKYVQVVEKETKIYIQSVQPDIIYVPTYNPRLVYGNWWHSHQPRAWHYRHGQRHRYSHNRGLGVHISTGNVAINWNPFRHVRHNYWSDRYYIQQRHQIFENNLRNRHRSHAIHRQQQWGVNQRRLHQPVNNHRNGNAQRYNSHRANPNREQAHTSNNRRQQANTQTRPVKQPPKRAITQTRPVKQPPKRAVRNTVKTHTRSPSQVKEPVRTRPVKQPPKKALVKRNVGRIKSESVR